MPRVEVHKLMERMAIPAIAAPMFLVSNPALTLACCSEGIMGSFPAHGTRPSLSPLSSRHSPLPSRRRGPALGPDQQGGVRSSPLPRRQRRPRPFAQNCPRVG